MKRITTLACALASLLAGQAMAADVSEPLPDVLFQLRNGQAAGSINEQIARNFAVSQSLSAVNPKNYGAVCDGTNRSISATLGVSTIATLAAKTTPSGLTPYSWINNGQWSAKVAVPLIVNAATSATTLAIRKGTGIPTGAVVSGTQVNSGTPPTVSAITNPSTVSSTLTGGTISSLGTKAIPLTSAAGIVAGSVPVPQNGLSIDDYVVSVSTNTLTMKYGTTATITNGATLTFQPPSIVTITGAGLTGNKPSLVSGASTPTVNYWLYFAWPLTDAMVAAGEMDWLGIQTAIQVAAAQTNGGIVTLPSGKCQMDNATVSGNALGGLVIPQATGGTSFTNSVDVVGNGRANTYLNWGTDQGVGRSGVSFGVPYATWDNGLGHYGANFYFGRFGQMTMLGPNGYSEPAVGTQTAQMNGLTTGARRDLTHLGINGFGVGMSMEGVDHTRWDELYITSNSVGMRMGPASQFLQSNNVFDHIEVWSNAIANMSVDKSGFMSTDDFHTLYCSFSPKCWRLEQGPQDSYSQPSGISLQYSTWESVLAEAIGNCFICDDNQGPITASSGAGGAELNMTDMVFNHVTLGNDVSQKPAGTLMNYWLQLNATYNSRFIFNKGGLPFVAGMLGGAYLDFANFGNGGDLFSADMTGTIANYGATPIVSVAGDIPSSQQQYAIRVEEPRAWSGHIEMVNDAVSRAPGIVMEYTTGADGADLSVVAAAGTGIFAGINMQTTTNHSPTIVATRLCGITTATVTLPTSGTATANHYAKPATGGTVTNASSSSDNAIGVIMQSAAGQARVNVGPLGSCD